MKKNNCKKNLRKVKLNEKGKQYRRLIMRIRAKNKNKGEEEHKSPNLA